MNTKLITQGVLLFGLVLWIGWDVYAAINKTPGDTISEVVWVTIKAAPFVPFLAGFVAGHLFWCSCE